MKQLVNDINYFNNEIEKVSRLCLSNETVDLKKLLGAISDGISSIFPRVVTAYDRAELSEFIGEREYWVSQIERITDACTGDDVFLVVDVLYQETRANLKEFADRLVEKGLV